jgi:hypothetical protein
VNTLEEDLEKFMDNVEVIGDVATYKDDKGNYFEIEKKALKTSCVYLELTDKELATMKFEKKVDKTLDYPKCKVERPVTKDKITGKDKDKTTLVNQEQDGYKVWVVANGLKATKSFTNKEEALALAFKINSMLV